MPGHYGDQDRYGGFDVVIIVIGVAIAAVVVNVIIIIIVVVVVVVVSTAAASSISDRSAASTSISRLVRKHPNRFVLWKVLPCLFNNRVDFLLY